jgi:acyl-CoA thioesterase I
MRMTSLWAAAMWMLGALVQGGLLAQTAERTNYLQSVVAELEKSWPTNRTMNVVCHGHSVPAGYFKTPVVDSFHAYPHLLHEAVKERFPRAVVNVIVTAIGGENSVAGAARFERDVLSLRPDVVTIDYALNDRSVGLEKARTAWVDMIQKAQAAGIKVILLTPSPDLRAKLDDAKDPLNQHAEQVRALAAEFHVGLVDSLALFKAESARGTPMENLMSQSNHPNEQGHALIARELSIWFRVKPKAESRNREEPATRGR